LISDYFPNNKISTANAILSASLYFGAGISPLLIIFLDKLGWRQTLEYMGYAGILSGVLGLILIKEPKRGKYLA
jgi:sugar phosphate permease